MTENDVRYCKYQLSESRSVIYDRKCKKTLLVFGEFSEDLIQMYEGGEEPKIINPNITTFVINVTDACNLRCKYCSRYHSEYSNNHIDEILLSHMLESIVSYSNIIGEKCVVQFHGGEPLLYFDIIQSAINRIDTNKLSQHLDLRIQTNGTLLNDHIIQYCNKKNIQLGISIDGPSFISDTVRMFSDGQGISKVLENNLNKIRNSANNNNISCLCVITKESIGRANEVFRYIVDNGIHDLSILPLYNDYSCISDDRSIIPRNEEMAEFSEKIIDCWISSLKEGNDICIPNFQIWVWNLLANNTGTYFNCHSCCGAGETMVFVEKNGDIYPCGPFSHHQNMKMGNILSIQSLLDSPNPIRLEIMNRLPFECEKCGLQGICKGGCFANSYLQKHTLNSLDPYCNYWKRIITYLINVLMDNPELVSIIPSYTIRM